MGSIYGKPVKQEVKIPTPYDAIQKLHRQVDTINLSVKQKTTLAETYHAKAKECVDKGKRDDAKLYLEKKAILTKRITDLTKMASVLEAQIIALESANMNRDIIRATEVATTAMKNVVVSPDSVSDVMESVRETIENVNEVSTVLGEPMGESVDVSEELDAMLPSEPVMPQVPTVVHEVQKQETSIEQEIARLEVAA